MAGTHTLDDQDFAQGAIHRRKRALTLALVAGALLVIVPVALDAFVAERPQSLEAVQHDAALTAYSARAVDLDGAIMQFSQQGNAIALSLMASDDGQRIFVQDAAGELFEIPVSPGQTHVSAELPAHFASSETLTIRVD